MEEIVCDPPPQASASRADLLAPLPNVADLLGYHGHGSLDIDNRKASLQNAGNTCYLNALLSVLARVPALRHWVDQHLQKCYVTHAGFNCCLCAIAQDLSRLCIDVSPVPFIPEIVRLRGDWSRGLFAGNDQQDVTETIDLLLNTLNAVDEHAALALRQGLFNNAHPCRYTTPMWQTLKISYTNRMTCHTCHMESLKEEVSSTLFLDLPDTPTTLQTLVTKYWGDQPQKEGDDPYRCPREPPCRTNAVVTKDIQPTSWPPVLLLGLKRWRFSMRDGRPLREKVPTKIDFSTNFTPVPGAPEYQLRGVIEHHGPRPGGGHYTSYVRHHDNLWSFCDDSRPPQPRSVENVLEAQAYVLVYEA